MIKTGRIRNLLICTLTASMLLSSMTSAFGAEISIESEESGYAELSSIEEAEPYAELSSTEDKPSAEIYSVNNEPYVEIASLPTDEDDWYSEAGQNKRLASANNAADAFIKEFITDDMDEYEKAFYTYKWLSRTEYSGIKYSFWVASNYNTRFSYWYDKDTGLFLSYSYLTQAEYENTRAIELANGRPDTYPAIGTPEFNERRYFADGKVYAKIDIPYPSSEEERKVLEEYGTVYAAEAYGALIQKLVTCGGYADAYQLILKKLGINCKLVGNLDHAWNEVIIKDYRFVVDPTNEVFGVEIPMNVGFLEPGYPLEWQTHTINETVYALHQKIYGTDMPKRQVFGRWWGGRAYNTTIKKDLGNGNYIEVQSFIPYSGKKIKPYVVISYNGVQINSSDKKYGPKLKFKNNKNAGKATVTITGIKGKNKYYDTAALSSAVKGQTIEFTISTLLVDDADVELKVKRKGGIVKSVKVRYKYGDKPKWQTVKKNMWKVNGDNLEFSGNYEGSVSLNSI